MESITDSLDLTDLEVEASDFKVEGVPFESLTNGHGMTEVGASIPVCCSCVYCFSCCSCFA